MYLEGFNQSFSVAYVRPISGSSKPEVETIASKKFSEAGLFVRLDSFSQINKVREMKNEDVGKGEVLDKDKEPAATDKLRLKFCSINEASRKLLFHTCPNLYQSEYTGANVGSPSEKAVFNFLSGEDIETTIAHINSISESQLREELGDVDENQSTNFLSEQSLCLVAIRIGLIKEFMSELYTNFDKDIRKFLDEILIKVFERCASHAENAKLFDYGGQENLASDKPKFALFSFDLPLSSAGYKTLRGGTYITKFEDIFSK